MPAKLVHEGMPVLSLLLAATLWGLLWYPLRLLGAAGVPGVWVTFIAYASALAVCAPLLGHHWTQWRAHPFLLAVLGLAAGWCNLSFIIAVTEGMVVRVVLLFYLSPLWTVLFGRLFLGERLTAASTAVLVMALTGAMIVLWDPSLGFPWPQESADWLGISAGVAFALHNVTVRGLQTVDIPVKLLANIAGGVVIAGVWVAVNATVPDVGPLPWLACVALGVFGIIVMTLSVQYGVTHMPVQRSAVIMLFEVIVAAVSAQILANEVPGARDFIGGALIVAASILAARRSGGPVL